MVAHKLSDSRTSSLSYQNVVAVQGEGAQGKTADTGVKASDGNVYWFDSNPPRQKKFKNFQKTIDKSIKV